MSEDIKEKIRVSFLELVRISSVTKNASNYAMQHIWEDAFKRTRYTAYTTALFPAAFNFSLILLRRRIRRQARLILSITSLFLCGIIYADTFRRDMIKYSLQDPLMFQKLSLVLDMRNLVVKSEFERMQSLIENAETDTHSDK